MRNFCIAALAALALQAHAVESCSKVACSSGSRVLIKGGPVDIYYGCESPAQAEYVNFVILMIGVLVATKGTSNISPATGEPALAGDEKVLLDRLRAKAGVATVGEAITHYTRVQKNVLATVFDAGLGGTMMKIGDPPPKRAYWLPKDAVQPVN
tara:strand:- start:1369 stop:1830 length:462 start_codon:yes stop_codon:yes gene_type:complete